MWPLLITILLISIIGVIKAADIFVQNLVDIGSFLDISEMVLGVTASAIGTSLPEFGSAIMAILTGNPEIGVGTVIGANMWNIGGILGISAAISGPMFTERSNLKRDGLMVFLTTLILFLALFILREINFYAGIILIAFYGVYFYFLVTGEKGKIQENRNQREKRSINIPKKLIGVILGILGLVIGCRIIVYCMVELSIIFNIPAMLAGIILSFGTTSPEFFTVFSSARRGLNNLAIGTVLGSNIFNIMVGLGVPALLVTVPVENLVIVYDAPALIVMTVLVLALLLSGKKLSRKEGLILIFSYAFYILFRTMITV